MKVSILQENISKSLNIINRAVSTKSNLEILGYILLKTDKGRVRMTATNLEIGISSLVGGKVDKEGGIALPARLFTDFINSIPNKKVDLEIKEGTIKCKSENYESEIKGLSADEFPLIPNMKDGLKINIQGRELKEAINLVAFAAATDESRPVLSGVYLGIKDSTLTLAATDSYRLAEKKIKLKNKTENKEVIIPARSLLELGKILEEGDVEIYLNENQAFFQMDNIEFTTRLIEGKFPDYEKIIPEETETKISLVRDEFLSAIKVTSLFSRETTNSVSLNIKSKGDVEISSPETQSGSSNVILKAEVDGKGGEIIFNSKYLVDILNNFKEQKISFQMNDRVSAVIIKTEKDTDYLYIVMPLRG